jgi:hypothetical protein
MVLIIQVFIVKSTLLCKKNTKDSFFTTKSKNNAMASASMADISIKGDAYLQYADNGIVQSGSNTSNRKRVNLNVIGKSTKSKNNGY